MTTKHRLMCIAASTLLVGACSSTAEPEQSTPQAADAKNTGPVTEAEYRQAVQSASECVAAAGYTVGPVTQGAGRSYGFDMQLTGEATAEQQQSLDQTYATCFEENVGDKESRYLTSLAATGEEREQLFERFIQCAEQADFQGITPDMTEEMVVAALAEQSSSGAETPQMADGLRCMDQFATLWYGEDK